MQSYIIHLIANDITVHESKYPKNAKQYLVATVFEISTIYGSLLPLFIHTFVLFFAKQNYSSYCEFFFKPISVINWPVATYKFLFLMCGFFHALPLICVCTWETIKVVLTQTIIVTRLVAQAFVALKCIPCHKEGYTKEQTCLQMLQITKV